MSTASEAIELARESFATAYVTAACAIVLLYDYLLTIGFEIDRTWTAKWSVPKTLFLLDRYIVIPMLVFNGIVSTLTHLPPKFCVFYLRWLVITVTTVNAVVEGILLSRIWALYKSNTLVLAFVCLLYILGISSLVGLTIGDYVAERVVIEQDLSDLPGCYAESVPGIIAGYWIVPLVVESVFFILVIWRVVVWSRENASVPVALALMARDSALYFACVFILLFVNLLVFEYGPPFLSSLFVTPVNTVGCLAGSRMLLNLKQLGVRSEDDSELEMVRFVCPRLFMSRGGNISTREVVFNHNHTNLPDETFASVA